jgi:hypothetical protein
MPPKTNTNTKTTTQTNTATPVKPPVKPKKDQEKKPTKVVYHDFLAVDQKVPDPVNSEGIPLLDESGNPLKPSFTDAITFYEKEFLKELCVSRDFMSQKASQRYVINPRTGCPYDSYIRTYDHKFTNTNSVKIGERTISLTKFLTLQKFCDQVISYYRKLGYECEIYDTGFDKTNQRYSRVCIKVKF